LTNFPWPLDKAQEWFEDLWNHVSSAASHAVGRVRGWVDSVGDMILQGLNDTGTWIVSTLQGALEGIMTAVQDSISWLSQSLGDAISGLWETIQGFIDSTTSFIMSAVDEAWQSVQSWISELWNNAMQAFDQFVADSKEFINGIISMINESFGKFISDVKSFLETGWEMFTHDINALFSGLLNWFMEALQGMGQAITSVFNQGTFSSLISSIESGFSWLADSVASLIFSFFDWYTRIEIPETGDPREVIRGILTELMKSAVGMTLPFIASELVHPMKSLGMGRLSALLYDIGGFGVLAYNINSTIVNTLTTPKLKYALNYLVRPWIPPAEDLVTFYAREAINPEDFRRYMHLQGFDDFFIDAYLAAHWVPPPIHQVYDLLRRRLIDLATAKDLIKRLDIMEEMREPLAKLAYLVPPRVDVRRGYEYGLLSAEEVDDYLRKGGYSDEDAVILGKIQRRLALSAEISDLRREFEKDYVDGFIDEDTFRANLAELGFPDELIEFRVEAIKTRHEREYKREQIRIYREAFRKDLITAEDLKSFLLELGLSEEKADPIVTLEQLKKVPKPK